MTIRQQGIRPPAGTPRRAILVFDSHGHQHLASGLKNPSEIRGPGRPPEGLRPGPGAAVPSTLDMAGRPEASNLALLQLCLAHLA